MKISPITTVYNLIYCLCSLQCSESEITTFKELTILDNEPFFSFDKKTFGNLKFNLTDDVISPESLTKTSFDQQTPLEVFVNTFCMFYKYSKIKNDDEFRTTISNFFNAFYEGNLFYGYSMVTVENYLQMLFAKIKEILMKKELNCKPVLIQEIDGRIICKPNDLYKQSKNDENGDCKNTLSMEETHKDYVNLLMKFNELYLKGFFKNDFVNSFKNLNDEYSKRIFESNYSTSIKFDQELFELYLKVYQNLQKANVRSYYESEEEIRKLIELLLNNSLRKYACQIIKRDFNDKTPKYLTEKNLKVASKVFFYMSENQDIFSSYSDKDKQTVDLLKEQHKKYFEGRNLSTQSIDSLVMRCLEVEV